MPESTLDSWIVDSPRRPSLIHAVQPERRGWPRLPFIAVIEAYVLRSLRELGAPMDQVRLAAETVRHELGDEYALASKRIATDGVDVFVRLADESVLQVKHRQLGIREVLADYLTYVTWDDDGRPVRLRLSQYPEQAPVILDPRFGWGSPVLSESKVPVDAVLKLWRNGEPMSEVAAEYGLSTDVVEGVLRAASAA
ncbi:DUF433 domain-containing protein [Nocardioides marinquilinus]|uniref:DUF433 domain-containing protein n=2 Tax=Nocardioides marinquilinus TaxID=1210400 RepID=A0ABP9PBF6_9ACTN